MPKIDLCFSGWLRGVTVKKAATTCDGEDVDVRKLTSEELVEKLNNGDLVLSFEDALKNSQEDEIELTDYEATDED